jgi:hypothetical protein
MLALMKLILFGEDEITPASRNAKCRHCNDFSFGHHNLSFDFAGLRSALLPGSRALPGVFKSGHCKDTQPIDADFL